MQKEQTGEKKAKSESTEGGHRLSSSTQGGRRHSGQTITFCLLKSKWGRQRPAFLQCAWPGRQHSAGSYWSFLGPNFFLPCFPILHLTAFLNDLISKLFSKATINYSMSSILQPQKETVQSISLGSCLLCTWSPAPQSAVPLWVAPAGGSANCSASPRRPCDMNI